MRLRIQYNPVDLADVLAEGKTEEQYNELASGVQESVLNSVRTERTLLLAESDWTQYNDSPLSAEKKAEWATYRQALRDITDSLDFSDSMIIDDTFFPAKPE